MRLPFVWRFEADRVEERRKKLWDELDVALWRNGELRRRVWSLELENTEFLRQLGERDKAIAQYRRQLEEHDARKRGGQ